MFKPCGHRLVIQRDPVEETYGDSGIIIHANENQQKLDAANCQMGVIVAIGPDCWEAFRKVDSTGNEVNGKPWASVGDYVLYAKYAGKNVIDPFTPEDKDLIILNDEDIIAIVTEGETVIPTDTVREAKGA
jgi:co-chaperonin GroES (HSP10)